MKTWGTIWRYVSETSGMLLCLMASLGFLEKHSVETAIFGSMLVLSSGLLRVVDCLMQVRDTVRMSASASLLGGVLGNISKSMKATMPVPAAPPPTQAPPGGKQ